MMSASDMPGNMTAPPPSYDESTQPSTSGTEEDKKGELTHIWKFIYCDMSFVKSLYGILIAVELVLSLLGLISVSVPKNEGCAYLYSGSYSYFEFVSSSCFITCIIWYILYGLAVTKKLGFIRWDITEMIWCIFYAFMYLISSSVLASHACMQDGYKAAAAFGFLCLFAILAQGFLVGRPLFEKYRGGRAASSDQAATGSPADTAEDSKY